LAPAARYLVTLLTLDADEASALAARLGIGTDLAAMARDDRSVPSSPRPSTLYD
jgi:hypothetical protein